MAAVSLPTGSFSLGTTTAETAIDMSLDDLIKNRRETAKTDRKKGKKTDILPSGTPNAVQKSTGKGKAAKQALVNKRRGLQKSNKPTKMEIDDEVNRQKQKSNNAKATARNKAKKAKDANKPVLTKEQQKRAQETERKANQLMKIAQEAVEKAANGKAQPAPKTTARPPSKKAVKAAVDAMNLAGYHAPDGMRMVVKFEPMDGNTDYNNDNRSPPRRFQEQQQQRQTPRGRRQMARNQRGNGRSSTDEYRNRRRQGNGQRGPRFLER